MIDGSGTKDDLVADAHAAGHHATPRLVVDWESKGLLDRPVKQPRGRGRGSAKALYSKNQRRLFLALLEKRPGNHISSLARIPLFIWMYWGNDHVPTRQALRAFTTWLGDFRSSKEAARKAAVEVAGQLDHPGATTKARRALVRTLAEMAYTGCLDELQLCERIRAVFEPDHSSTARAVGPSLAPLTTDAVVRLISARLQAALHVRDGRVTVAELERVRDIHLLRMAEYLSVRPTLAADATAGLASAFDAPTHQLLVEKCGLDLLTVLGFEIQNH